MEKGAKRYHVHSILSLNANLWVFRWSCDGLPEAREFAKVEALKSPAVLASRVVDSETGRVIIEYS